MRKPILLIAAACLLLVVFLPILVLNFRPFQPRSGVKITGPGIRVKMHDTGKVVVMPLEEYLIGVVAAEMPAKFHKEALKAQAVAARTYTLKKLTGTVKSTHHPNAEVCTDPNHCQGWLSKLEMRRRWGLIKYWSYYKKIAAAVKETEGMVITYRGRLIEPVYHSTSGGRTEDAAAVWKYSFPYLKSVECKWDKESPRYLNTRTFTLADVDRRLNTDLHAAPALATGNRPLIKVLQRTVSGRVKTIQIGGRRFSGTELRRLLDLSSTYIDWEVHGDKITFKTRGYGHGVGLCQYGANGLARRGKSFQAILTYYYRGVRIEKYD